MKAADMPPEDQARAVRRVERAAIRHAGQVYSVPQPGRHHDVIHMMAAQGFGPECMHEQGFVDSGGDFVNRWQAARIARDAEQLLPIIRDGLTIKRNVGPETELFSEDVW